VIGGPSARDPLAVLDGLRRSGGRLDEGIIHLAPGQNPQLSRPDPKFISTGWVAAIMSSRNSAPNGPSGHYGGSSFSLMAINREAIAHLPDGATITLREMLTSL
jgi:hypothetical protein